MNGNNESSCKEAVVHHVLLKGDGYINEVKSEKSRKDDEKEIFRVKMSMLHGNKEKPKREFYSLLVEGKQANEVIERIVTSINDSNKKVSATVALHKGDSSPFIFETGKKAGQLGVTHFGSLIGIRQLHIDGEKIFSLDS